MNCSNNEICDKISGKNQYKCVKGKCKETVCNRDGDCPPNNYCKENECIPIKLCKNHRDCDRGDFCRNGKCESSCEKDLVGLNS